MGHGVSVFLNRKHNSKPGVTIDKILSFAKFISERMRYLKVKFKKISYTYVYNTFQANQK